ncbi:hypothetical protein [Streptomyces atratus]|uniref:hypothetical protein n=1 Tax=Streptomyces atratus TaxID=1893 RepID=UPI002AC35880|nr:hypothetical protein [Streptomyces atratus]WPW26804.1 hypothetical protein P6B95_04830 [Streptomyces atratus]
MNDSTPAQRARELLTQASQHPVASPQRDALVAEAAVWARLEHAAVMEHHTAAVADIESVLASFADPVQKLGSELGNLTEHIKLSQR